MTTKGDWPDEIHRVIWSYHTTPQSTTDETPFNQVYWIDAMIPIKIAKNAERVRSFDVERLEQGLQANLDTSEEVWELARISGEAVKRRVERRYKTNVNPRSFQETNLVLRKAQLIQMDNKLAPKWTRPYRMKEVVGAGAYKLETLLRKEIPRTWNAANLRFYFT